MATVSLSLAHARRKQAASGSDRAALTGAWRLVSLEQPAADGILHRVNCSGLLVYTSDGHMSVQVMDADPAAGASSYSRGGYEASFGTFDLDQNGHTFTFHVEGALVRTLVGQDLLRAYELNGRQLTVKSTNPGEHWRVVWERD
uniref:Lipocalin-like domain-containing protein n=2 Tax=Paracidobacterium acidisoli TaxID=2303751 RepID=A0A372IKY5_9BACT